MITVPTPADRAERAHARPGLPVPSTSRPEPDPSRLERYRAPDGTDREVVSVPAAGGSVLVLDRPVPRGSGDQRVVAHLAADEPPINAEIVCARYLADRRASRPCSLPRTLREDDLVYAPLPDLASGAQPEVPLADGGLLDDRGRQYRLACVPTALLVIAEVRWLREPVAALGPSELVSVRDVVGALQDYEPARALSVAAVRRHDGDPKVSVAILRAELGRVMASPIVLNRRLRERVVQSLARDGLSMSEIAVRCGRVKRDRRGNLSGETSWLGRRLGILPEGGEEVPTPWIHSEVLALIARCGLGLCPREVEL